MWYILLVSINLNLQKSRNPKFRFCGLAEGFLPEIFTWKIIAKKDLTRFMPAYFLLHFLHKLTSMSFNLLLQVFINHQLMKISKNHAKTKQILLHSLILKLKLQFLKFWTERANLPYLFWDSEISGWPLYTIKKSWNLCPFTLTWQISRFEKLGINTEKFSPARFPQHSYI